MGLSAWRRDLVLVIADVHFREDPEIGSALDALFSYATPTFRMLLATRRNIPGKVANANDRFAPQN